MKSPKEITKKGFDIFNDPDLKKVATIISSVVLSLILLMNIKFFLIIISIIGIISGIYNKSYKIVILCLIVFLVSSNFKGKEAKNFISGKVWSIVKNIGRTFNLAEDVIDNTLELGEKNFGSVADKETGKKKFNYGAMIDGRILLSNQKFDRKTGVKLHELSNKAYEKINRVKQSTPVNPYYEEIRLKDHETVNIVTFPGERWSIISQQKTSKKIVFVVNGEEYSKRDVLTRVFVSEAGRETSVISIKNSNSKLKLRFEIESQPPIK